MKRLLIKFISLGIFVIFFIAISSLYAFAGNPPDAANSSLVATSLGSDEVAADGSTTASLTLTFEDSSGTPLAGDTVSLSAPSDVTAVFSPTSTTLDASGIATFSATSTTAGTDQITATDVTTGTDLVALGQVIFDPVPTPTSAPSNPSNSSNSSTCSNTYPTDAPNLYQVSIASGSADLYFVEPSSQFDGYTISYGLTQDADTYNVSFSQGRVGSATKYTINDLALNTKYYFKVRANNGCAPGPWSTVLGSNDSGGGSLPATGPGNILIKFGLVGILTFLAGLALFVAI